MRGDAKVAFLMICGSGLVHVVGFWTSVGYWPFTREGPGTALLKSTFGDDFDVPFLGDCIMRSTLSVLFYPLAMLSWALCRAPDDEDAETPDAEEAMSAVEELEIEE